MAHPHPHPEDLGPLDTGGLDVELPEPGAHRPRWIVLGAFLAAVIVLAVVLVWVALRRGDEAEQNAAAAQAACGQVEGLGQKCVTGDPGEQTGGGQAVVPVAPSTSLPALPGRPIPSTTGPAGTPGPDESAADPGMPGDPLTNPGADEIVGLTVRAGRLEVTYADGNVVDAGAVGAAPPAIVLIVPSPAADGRGPDGVPASPPPVPVVPVPTGPMGVDAWPTNDPYDPAGGSPPASEGTYVP